MTNIPITDQSRTVTHLRRLLVAARAELGNARDLALGATTWTDGGAEDHWNGEGQGARLLRRIDAQLEAMQPTPHQRRVALMRYIATHDRPGHERALSSAVREFMQTLGGEA